MGGSASKAAGAPFRFSDRTTGEDIADAFPQAARGKTVLITGATAGLGFETARVLAARGATVLVGGRSDATASAAVAKLREAVPGAAVEPFVADLADLAAARAAGERLSARGTPLHLLINNAGVMACPLGRTADGYETQWASNHLGHFALTQALLPALQRGAPSRVVNLSSMGSWIFTGSTGATAQALFADPAATALPYDPWARYGASKLANILHAQELTRRHGGAGVTGVAVHPGAILATSLARHFSASLATTARMLSYPRALWVTLTDRMKTVPEGVSTTLLAALAPLEASPEAAAAGVPAAACVKPGGYYADCALETRRVNPLVGDAAAAARLWELSEQQLGAALARAAAAAGGATSGTAAAK